MKLCADLDLEFKVLKRDLESLKRYAVTVKVDNAEDAYDAVKRVRELVRSKLKIK